MTTEALPIVDIGPLVADDDADAVAPTIDAACRDTGFFLVAGHGVDPALVARLDAAAREFFARPESEKATIAMEHGGRAWRGWFPVGGELTSGRPDRKEGVYFGAELAPDDPRVRAGVPLHGPNLFPAEPPELRDAVLEYLHAMTTLGHALLRGFARALDLDADWFARELTADPTILFRIFHYPPLDATDDAWSVGEHTDYGLLTILLQDDTGGLQVHARTGWVDVAPVPHTFVCNLGDMLERMTGGRYRSTPHRVRNTADRSRLSFPFFFDPGWDARVQPIPAPGPAAPGAPRWDDVDPTTFEGTYGEYLLGKVSKVFPSLGHDVL
ncbi:MAG TPA: 2-oxoglutarate and iron-dependent oxygenase domain-containing protein [Acidimicrobiia bacterium]|nr:2-oxoglutarate and iron-dependent oxygenase domain-containing protein [Acidimicrobiia bacterium]